ncbi:MAG: histidinol-phosphatase HisJ family protein [Bulleidia sp.]|nr:histidinol-phosphatase HisJ family protein [Bulleidia sp.]
MYADYHLHCEYSDDSNEPMENQIQEAITLGLDEMCFTDHVDYGIKRDWDDPEGIIIRHAIEHGKEVDLVLANVNYPKYFEALNMYQKKYASSISSKKGLEFGIQSITVDAYEKLYASYQDDLDFILFSMHQVNNLEFWTQDFQKGKTQKEYNDEYYKEIYQTMQMFHHYSCLAHLDLMARYDENGIYPFENEKDIIAEILKYAIRDGKGIEINTSSWKYGLKDTQPSRAILKLYKDLGGKIITVGSDAHETKYLASHIKDAYAILKNEIGINEICTFDHMQPIFHKI